MSLARATPELDILKLSTGATVSGLIGLTSRCPNVFKICIHFQASRLVEAATTVAPPSGFDDEPIVRQKEWALTDLAVGETPIPAESEFVVTLMLLHIFPCILNVDHTNREWKTVAGNIKHLRRIGTFVHRSGKADPSHVNYP